MLEVLLLVDWEVVFGLVEIGVVWIYFVELTAAEEA